MMSLFNVNDAFASCGCCHHFVWMLSSLGVDAVIA